MAICSFELHQRKDDHTSDQYAKNIKEKYDESLVLTEDLHYGKDLSRHGKYFFMKTKNVLTSARRFEKRGYVNMFFTVANV